MADEAKSFPLVFFRTEAGAEPVRDWLRELPAADRKVTRRIARVLVFAHEGELVALHGFIKKTRTTPAADLKLARKRKQDYERTT